MQSKNNKNIKEVNEIYLQERARLIECGNRSMEQFDKGVLTISSGSLALTITFVKDLVSSPVEGTIKFLVFTWILLGTSMLITLISFLLSHQAFIKAIKSLGKEEYNRNILTTFTHIFNFLSAGTLISGFVFWGIFTVKNFYSTGG